MKVLFDYQVVCRRDDNGSFVANVPAIDGCHASGRTPEEAQQELQNVFEMISEEYAEGGKSLPNDMELIVLQPNQHMLRTPRPPGYFADCLDKDEIEESNWFAARGGKIWHE